MDADDRDGGIRKKTVAEQNKSLAMLVEVEKKKSLDKDKVINDLKKKIDSQTILIATLNKCVDAV